MTCEELQEMYELYAMGVSDDLERDEISAHLGRGCVSCTKGVQRAFETVSLIGTTAFDVAPPPRLRARVLASVSAAGRPQRFWNMQYAWMGLAAGLAAVALEIGRAHV